MLATKMALIADSKLCRLRASRATSPTLQRPPIPNHVTAKFSTSCDTCHSVDNWLNAKFDHSTTGFLLTGGHSVPPRECIDCHVNNNYNLTSVACFSCHQKDFASATTPVPHKGFPKQ